MWTFFLVAFDAWLFVKIFDSKIWKWENLRFQKSMHLKNFVMAGDGCGNLFILALSRENARRMNGKTMVGNNEL
jgi:hypothetical protein